MTEKRFVKGYHTIRDTKENNTYDFHVNIICDLLNELSEENEELKKDICNHIQRRLNECQNGGVKQFVDEEFVLQQGRGYSLALFDVKKSLIEEGLWSISVGDWYGRVNTDGDMND